MKRIQNGIAASVLALCVAAPTLGYALPHGTGPSSPRPMINHSMTPPAHNPQALGQPNQSCGSPAAPNTPGNAAQARGSAFNPNGIAGMHYAGQQLQNSRNPASVAQYDVACSNQPH